MFTANARARRVAILATALIVLCFFGACSQQGANNSEPTPVLSEHPSTALPMPPAITEGSSGAGGWTHANGKRVSLAEQRGQVLVLDFYETWCEQCRQSIPNLINLHERY